MKVAIVGGLGFIGRELAWFLKKQNCDVSVYDVQEYSLSVEDPFYYYKVSSTKDCITDVDAEAIVLLAAKRPYDNFSLSDFLFNIQIAGEWFRTAKANNIKNVIFASSKAVYSDQTTIPWNEDMLPTPQSLYGASKAAIEQLAEYYNCNEMMNIKCLRFAQVIGEGERKGYLINTLIDNAKRKERQIIYGDGSQKRQYIYIKDVCSAISAAIRNTNAKGVFNIGMKGAFTNLELAEAVNKAFDNIGNIACDTTKQMSNYCDEMLVDKAEQVLGWKALFDLEEIFKDIK